MEIELEMRGIGREKKEERGRKREKERYRKHMNSPCVFLENPDYTAFDTGIVLDP